jgi:hypothetical protein
MLKRVKSRLAFVAVAIVTAVSGHLVAAAPAEAAWSDCPSGWFCLWTGENGTGGLFYTAAQPQDLGFMNNNARSVWNRSNWHYCLYDATNHTVYLGIIHNWDQRANLGSPANRISSLGKQGGVC